MHRAYLFIVIHLLTFIFIACTLGILSPKALSMKCCLQIKVYEEFPYAFFQQLHALCLDIWSFQRWFLYRLEGGSKEVGGLVSVLCIGLSHILSIPCWRNCSFRKVLSTHFYVLGRQREIFHIPIYFPSAFKATSATGRSWELKTPFQSPTWVAGTQVLKLSSTASWDVEQQEARLKANQCGPVLGMDIPVLGMDIPRSSWSTCDAFRSTLERLSFLHCILGTFRYSWL